MGSPVRRGRSGYFGPTTSPASSWSTRLRATASRCRRSKGTSNRSPPPPRPSDITPATSPCSHPSPATVTFKCPAACPGWASPPMPRRRSRRAPPSTAARVRRGVLPEIVRTKSVAADLREAGYTAEHVREFIHRLKPLTIAGLVTAYEQAMDDGQASLRRQAGWTGGATLLPARPLAAPRDRPAPARPPLPGVTADEYQSRSACPSACAARRRRQLHRAPPDPDHPRRRVHRLVSLMGVGLAMDRTWTCGRGGRGGAGRRCGGCCRSPCR